METKDVPTAGQFKIWQAETKSTNNQKIIKKVYHEDGLFESKFKHEIYSDIKKFKIKPLKNCMASILILIFGLSQNIEAKTGKIDFSFISAGIGGNGLIHKSPFKTDNKLMAPPATCTNVGITSSSQTNLSCNGSNNGSATVTVSGGPFNGSGGYSWVNSANTVVSNGLTAGSLAAGNYTFTATNTCGNSASRVVTITQPVAITLTVATTSTICNGSSVSLSAGATGGAGSFTYTWMPGVLIGANQTVNPTVTTVYTVTAKDGSECSSSATQIVNVTSIAASVTRKINVTCNGLSNGSATVTASGGSGLNYSWSPRGGTSSIAAGLSPDTYTCVVTNSCGNSATVTQKITEPTPCIVLAGSSSTVNCNSTASLTASASGGVGPYTYTWNPGNLTGATRTVTPSGSTSYTVTSTDANACSTSATQMVTVNGVCLVSVVSCGISYSTFNSYQTCQAVDGAVNYSFTFYDNATNAFVTSKIQPSNYIYFNSLTGLNYGKTYKWSVAVDNGSGFGPESNNSCPITFNAPQTTVPCGQTFSTLNSYLTCLEVYKATNYNFKFYDINNNLMAEKIQPSNYIYFNTVMGLKYNTTYKWTVQVQYDSAGTGNLVYGPASSNSCPITFNAPQTTVSCGQSFSTLSSYLTCMQVSNATNYHFKFYDGGTLVAEKKQPSNYIYFSTVMGLNYAKTYNWTVEVEYNDPVLGLMYGPSSSALCTITFNAPQSYVPCGISIGIDGYTVANPVSGASAYRFNFYDVTTDALVATQTCSTPYIYFNQVTGLVFNTTYKWTVEVEYNDPNTGKLMFGPASSSLCTVNYGPGVAIVIDETKTNNATARVTKQSYNNDDPQFLINVFPNPTKDKITVQASEAINTIKVYTISGQLLLDVNTTDEVDLTNLKPGLYFVIVETENSTKNFKIIKE